MVPLRLAIVLMAVAAQVAHAAPPASALAPAGAAAQEHHFGRPKDAKAFGVWAVSSRAGMVFLDTERPDVRIAAGGLAGPVEVGFTITEHEGPWSRSGKVTLTVGQQPVPLPVELPGRGLFHLTLSAEQAGKQARIETSVAVLPPPLAPAEDSPWGIFYIQPRRDDPAQPTALADAVGNIRMLGASWVRLSFWSFAYGKVTVTKGEPPTAQADAAYFRRIAAAIHGQGMFIEGQISQCPIELSSLPNRNQVTGDAGPFWSRVKPVDYRLWDSMIEQLARDFRDEISLWEVWNEPDVIGQYWAGTPEELIELIHHTAAALRKGNPKARIAGCGFTAANAFAEKILTGAGKDLDVLSFHYSDEATVPTWLALQKKLGLALPMLNSEEKAEVPLRNIVAGIRPNIKFIHTEVGYGAYRPLMRTDLTALPSGVMQAVASHCISNGRFSSSVVKDGCTAWCFNHGDAMTGVFTAAPLQPKLFGTQTATLTLKVESNPQSGDKASPLRAMDTWGRPVAMNVHDGLVEVEFKSQYLYVLGAKAIELVGAKRSEATEGAIVAEAEAGRFSKGWGRVSHVGYSGGQTVDLWADADPDAEGYWVEVKFNVPKAGKYEMLFAGNALSRLKDAPSVSAFGWLLDDAAEQPAKSVEAILQALPGAREGLSPLGTVELTPGEHTFRLRLTARRQQPDKHYALWFDALVLRPAP